MTRKRLDVSVHGLDATESVSNVKLDAREKRNAVKISVLKETIISWLE